jgi:hypothetical protein
VGHGSEAPTRAFGERAGVGRLEPLVEGRRRAGIGERRCRAEGGRATHGASIIKVAVEQNAARLEPEPCDGGAPHENAAIERVEARHGGVRDDAGIELLAEALHDVGVEADGDEEVHERELSCARVPVLDRSARSPASRRPDGEGPSACSVRLPARTRRGDPGPRGQETGRWPSRARA